jgi:hypothetical protein|tara:strand:+ start:5062 stop:5301 length:240 start_codon:yes stop_codon:yes gene_type:complete
MDQLIDLLTTDETSPSQISDTIKDILYGKATARVDAYRNEVATKLFEPETEVADDEEEDQISAELDSEEEEEEEVEGEE